MMRRIERGSYMRDSWAGWPKEPIKEQECSGCGGTGFMAVVQPKELGRRIFPPRCSKCEGKGKLPSSK
jgi:DnaJ-class molecular chaperone